MKLLVRPPQIIRSIYKDSVWRMSKNDPLIYLTFDDGPIPELTPWVLDVLKQYGVKATFFCVGENIVKNQEIFERIKQEGHQVGNHTHNHIKGWEVSTTAYHENVEKCQEFTRTNLFRPPYGRIKKSQFKMISEKYKVVFWDVLSYDYDRLISPKKCLDNCLRYTRNGSIIVFHDNMKAEQNLKFALPHYIEHFLKLNYKFAAL
ncbi:MAG: polysaccharide deacetylase family protein [Bacteroidetes bacterium]|jgi:peptidoglycan/xylan/chitin deacetylase (PgdA/CDA1 family)|nr:polysaccharide deacetylase family protein [Bacteroidota bacterium]MDF2451009.1 polysaccharide deacetylase family protein [Bacteroidota bacterium]